MPDPENPLPFAEPCPACAVLMDVSGLEPWSAVICGACRETVRVRRSFHHYQILREVGLGGMSRVFGARDDSLGRDLALKILNPGLSQDDKRLRQFEQEARITASISHPNVVKVYTAGRDQGYFYIAMELVEGGSLDDRIRQEGRLPEAEMLDLAEQTVQGLKAASEAGLIHRDIKPGNILLSSSGTPKIVDFGLAVFTRDGVEDAEIWATPFYVPPETLFGEPEDFRSDVYALGSTLYHALTGKPLFDSDTNSLAALKALKSRPADLKPAAAFLSAETVAMLARTLKRKPAERYSSYDEFLDHLRYARRRLRRGGRGAPWPGRQGPGPAQWAGIAAAVALAGWGIWKMSGGGAAGEPAAGGLLADQDPALGTDSSVSTKFLAARATLARRDFPAARTQFAALAADPATRQPTLHWARYNAGLASLFAGDLDAARQDFSVLLTDSASSGEDESTRFFQASAAVLPNDAPVPESHAADCPPDSLRAIGLLAAGLKNWQLGDYEGAAAFLRAFATSTPPRSAAWIDRYKEIAQPWLDEIKIIDSLPTLPLTENGLPAATAQLDRARNLTAGLVLPGAGRQAGAERLRSLEQAIQQLEATAGEAAASALQTRTNADLNGILEAEEEALPLGLKFDFAEGASRLRQHPASTPGGKEMLMDRVQWWENAGNFLDYLAHDLTAPVEGTVERSQGPPLRGVISGNPQGLKVKPLSGPEVSLPFSACTPASLAALGERLLERTADSDEYYRRRELLVAFALRSGLTNYATLAGRELAREHPGFRGRWSRLGALP